MILAITYFDATYEDYQQQSFIEELLQFRLSNVGEISTSGLEIDLFGNPTDNLTLSGGIALIDAEIDSWLGGACYAGQSEASGCVGGTQNLSGGEVPHSPDLKLSMNARYDIPMGSNMMFLTGSYRYQDEIQSNWNQYPNSIVDSYGILNLSVGYEIDNYSFEFFCKKCCRQVLC
jgi:iron complex outermembrane receptor protein